MHYTDYDIVIVRAPENPQCMHYTDYDTVIEPGLLKKTQCMHIHTLGPQNQVHPFDFKSVREIYS